MEAMLMNAAQGAAQKAGGVIAERFEGELSQVGDALKERLRQIHSAADAAITREQTASDQRVHQQTTQMKKEEQQQLEKLRHQTQQKLAAEKAVLQEKTDQELATYRQDIEERAKKMARETPKFKEVLLQDSPFVRNSVLLSRLPKAVQFFLLSHTLPEIFFVLAAFIFAFLFLFTLYMMSTILTMCLACSTAVSLMTAYAIHTNTEKHLINKERQWEVSVLKQDHEAAIEAARLTQKEALQKQAQEHTRLFNQAQLKHELELVIQQEKATRAAIQATMLSRVEHAKYTAYICIAEEAARNRLRAERDYAAVLKDRGALQTVCQDMQKQVSALYTQNEQNKATHDTFSDQVEWLGKQLQYLEAIPQLEAKKQELDRIAQKLATTQNLLEETQQRFNSGLVRFEEGLDTHTFQRKKQDLPHLCALVSM